MTTFLGFHGPTPFSIIQWRLGEEVKSKTICFSMQEEVASITRLHTPGDIYSTNDSCKVIRSDDTFFEITKHVARGA